MEQKDKIVAGAKQYCDHVTDKIPQRDENGNIKYYFSGSLAMLLLSSAKSVKSFYVSKDGKVEKENVEFSIPQKNLESLNKGVRPLGHDVDVVTIDDKTFAGRGEVYQLGAIREKCDLATELCPSWKSGAGTMYFDWLADERMFDGYDVAELTMNDGTKVLIADPLCMTIHKLADAIKCKQIYERLETRGRLTPDIAKSNQDKYQKDIRDFSAMFNGVVALYPNVDFKKVIEHTLKICPQTAFSGIMNSNSTEKIKQFGRDVLPYIEPDNKEHFMDFINTVGKTNMSLLNKQETNTIS
ncbi:MAG: hypothetical protein J6Q51_03440 [Clostridia bacterium]|nr:hypothetical protein [Clostridia bacterium]